MYFRVIGQFAAFVRQSSLATDPNPYRQRISALCQFTPSIIGMIPSPEDEATITLDTITARIEDGVIKDIRGIPLDENIAAELPGNPPNHRRYGVMLVANSDALGLPTLDYTISFSRIVYGGQSDRRLTSFAFEAPRDDATIDLATVARLKPRKPVSV